MVKFKTEKISNRVTRIRGAGYEAMYLVEGDEKAALLDSGCGFGDLKGAVEKLTNKEVIVLITHGHVDHAMGALEFSEAYMNHDDDYIYAEHGKKDFRYVTAEWMISGFAELDKEDYKETPPLSHFKDMKPGDAFDLGGITIEIYDLRGHTKGSVAMLIKEERMILMGDGGSNILYAFQKYSLTIDELQRSVRKFKKETEGKYDMILLSHGSGDVPLEHVQGIIDICQEIKDGKADKEPFVFEGELGFYAKSVIGRNRARKDGGYSNIIYSDKKIYSAE